MLGLCALATNAAAHGGGLNAEGCHNDRKNGGYHCHRGGESPAPAPKLIAPKPADGHRYDGGRGGSGTYYANCSAARAAGAAPVRRGDPGYAAHLDRDNDGVGCE
ncbi:excalibur calcium-binding domain-containing protein [Lysobacter solisilvae]|uniref:Excalibur calcium-binding domain-containing protein n=1 Tax=Agrilutibacter solisilvae TaxID=2763317 RepID=A0A975AU05_9GAMM|nr:excalibur calcium-binding domain-containing protein [Lysobacter solisilvae]